MKYNYPIKYTAMPIIGIRRDDIICYIVSKCYLIADKTKYLENGETAKEYEVVFPYQQDQYNNWRKEKPLPRNSVLVEKVFDTYDEAMSVATKKNEQLCENTWLFVLDPEKIEEKKQEFLELLARYKDLEQEILNNTKELEPSNKKALNTIIINEKGVFSIDNRSFYDYLYYYDSPFVAYSVSTEQMHEMMRSIKEKDMASISRIAEETIPFLYHDYQKKNINLVLDNVGNVLYYINEWDHLKTNKEIPPIEMSSLGKGIRQVFTTEKLEDMIDTYNRGEYIVLEDKKKPKQKK